MMPYKFKMGQTIKTDVPGVNCDRGFLAHFQVAATKAVAAAIAGVHAARTCPALNVAATSIVKAASAETDILTVTAPISLGAAPNVLSILLTTNDSDALAVTKNTPDTDGIINIALAMTSANKNTASLIQAAIRALTSVNGVSVAAFTCAAGGNWDTAAVATGETAAVDFSGGETSDDVLVTGITSPSAPRNITATSDGTAGDIGAIQVIIEGTNFFDEAITETLPAFTANSKTTVAGNKAFKTVTKITIPAHDGLAATTAIGWGDKLGLPYLLTRNTVLGAYLDNAKEGTAPAVTVSATAIESNTIDLASALAGKVVDVDVIV